MAEFYHSTAVEIVQETSIDVTWSDDGKRFHIRVGEPCNEVTIMLNETQLNRLVDTLIVAQHEHDIRTGRVVPDDGSGLVPGGEPVRACQHGQDVQTCKACQGDLAYKLATR